LPLLRQLRPQLTLCFVKAQENRDAGLSGAVVNEVRELSTCRRAMRYALCAMRDSERRFDMFWYGLIVGLFIGANLGLLVFGLLKLAAGRPPAQEGLWPGGR